MHIVFSSPIRLQNAVYCNLDCQELKTEIVISEILITANRSYARTGDNVIELGKFEDESHRLDLLCEPQLQYFAMDQGTCRYLKENPLKSRPAQTLHLVFLKQQTSLGKFNLKDRYSAITADDMKLLREALRNGSYEVVGLSSVWETRHQTARALIVFKSPISRRVELKQPDGTSIVYVQLDNTFKSHPSDAAISQRKLILYQEGKTTICEHEGQTGIQGGAAIIWKEGEY